jgi:hypothetical protein
MMMADVINLWMVTDKLQMVVGTRKPVVFKLKKVVGTMVMISQSVGMVVAFGLG